MQLIKFILLTYTTLQNYTSSEYNFSSKDHPNLSNKEREGRDLLVICTSNAIYRGGTKKYEKEWFLSNLLVLPTSTDCNRAEDMKKIKAGERSCQEKDRCQEKDKRAGEETNIFLNEDVRNSEREENTKSRCKARKEKISTPKGLAEQRDM